MILCRFLRNTERHLPQEEGKSHSSNERAIKRTRTTRITSKVRIKTLQALVTHMTLTNWRRASTRLRLIFKQITQMNLWQIITQTKESLCLSMKRMRYTPSNFHQNQSNAMFLRAVCHQTNTLTRKDWIQIFKEHQQSSKVLGIKYRMAMLIKNRQLCFRWMWLRI